MAAIFVPRVLPTGLAGSRHGRRGAVVALTGSDHADPTERRKQR